MFCENNWTDCWFNWWNWNIVSCSICQSGNITEQFTEFNHYQSKLNFEKFQFFQWWKGLRWYFFNNLDLKIYEDLPWFSQWVMVKFLLNVVLILITQYWILMWVKCQFWPRDCKFHMVPNNLKLYTIIIVSQFIGSVVKARQK